MPAFETTLHIPTPEGTASVSREVSQTFARVPFNVDELLQTPVSTKWKLCRVPVDQIEPINSDWYQISTAPGVHIAGESFGTVRVAVTKSYLPWLLASQFNFKLEHYPLKPVSGEVSVHGIQEARRKADARFLRDAVKAFSSGLPGVESCYRSACGGYNGSLEWEILRRDIESDPEVCIRLAQGLLFIALNLLGNYDTPTALALLGKDQEQLLESFWSTDLSTWLLVADFEITPGSRVSQNIAKSHIISLLRYLVEFFEGREDKRQHKLDPRYTVKFNANIYGSIVGVSGSKPFGIFDPQKILDALATSPLFPDDTVRELDVIKLSAQMMAQLPIGFRNGHLDISLEVLNELSRVQVDTIHVQLTHFYREHPSLHIPENNMLVLLTCNSISMVHRVLVQWAASDDGRRTFERIVADLQGSQTTEHLILTLAALLCYLRLLPSTTPNKTNQPIKGSYHENFDTILDGQLLANKQAVIERMAFSVLRVLYSAKDGENMRPFLTSVLDTCPPALDSFHKFSDQYWMCRIRDGKAHKDAFKMVEIKCSPRSGEEKMALLDNEEHKEQVMVQASGATSTDACWVFETQWKEDHVVSRSASDVDDHSSVFPNAVFNLDAYKLVNVCLPEVLSHENILSTISLPDGSSAMIVLRSYVSALEREFDIECTQYNIEPSREDVELLGPVRAQNQRIDALARTAVDAIRKDNALENWIYVDRSCVLKLFTIWLEGSASQSKSDLPAFHIDNDVGAGRVLLDGYEFNSYTLVRVTGPGHCGQVLSKLGNFEEILSIEELEDGSWELAVRKSYLPGLKDELGKTVPGCYIEHDYNPTEPNAKEVEEFGYEAAKVLSKSRFQGRARHMMCEAWPRAAAFYADLASERKIVVLDDDEKGTDILESSEQEEVEMGEESTDGCWVIVDRDGSRSATNGIATAEKSLGIRKDPSVRTNGSGTHHDTTLFGSRTAAGGEPVEICNENC